MYRVGIDLGGTNIKAGIVNEKNEILIQDSVPTLTERPYQEVLKDMADLVLELAKRLSMDVKEMEGIGIGSPGTIDAEKGIVVYSNNFGWENVPVAQELGRYFTCPIRISNDANCATLGEVKAGAAVETRNVVLLTLGTGVGGGVVLDGKIFEGAHAGGVELGHTSLIFGGEPCTCGRKGCVEAYTSATALIRDAKRAAKQHPDSVMHMLCKGDIDNMNGKIPFDAALQGDKAATEVVENYIMYLGEAITDFVNIFRPDVVLLSGGICNQKERLTKPLSEYIKKSCFSGDKAYVPEVRCATLGYHAGIIGAANLI